MTQRGDFGRPVTGPVSGARERLAEALRDWASLPDPMACLPYAQREAVVDALLPVVESLADERAAEALEQVKRELHVLRFNADDDPEARWPEGAPQVRPDSFYRGIQLAELALGARASALQASHGEAR